MIVQLYMVFTFSTFHFAHFRERIRQNNASQQSGGKKKSTAFSSAKNKQQSAAKVTHKAD